MSDPATRKLFALVESLERKLGAIEQRLANLDTDGQLTEIKKEMVKVAANSQIVVSTVQEHGASLGRMERTLVRLRVRCPRLRPDTGEFQEVGFEEGGDKESPG